MSASKYRDIATRASGENGASHPAILTAEQKKELGGIDFQYNAIVFEGGGNKGLSATGAIRVLEELGYWADIKRFAGASAGSMVAALVAVGYDSHDIETFLRGDISDVFLDAKFGRLSLLPNMLLNYGWHPGKKIYQWFGERVKEKMGNPDLTFQELYKRRNGTELCITVSNANTMDCTYCHVKTTPDLPIRKAVQMSGCIPGFFCPVEVKAGINKDYFVDGGLLCNYPIHCYDGWYLSMDFKDSFLQRLDPFEQLPKLWDPMNRFAPKNKKTLGILLYSNDERELMKEGLVKRFEKHIKPSEEPKLPHTKLADARKKAMREAEEQKARHRALMGAFGRFVKVLKECDVDHSRDISQQEFETAMNKPNSEFSAKDKTQLFGENFTNASEFFQQLDTNGDGKELMAFGERRGMAMMDHFRGYRRQEINSMGSYFGSIVETLLLNMKRVFVQGSDVDRTIGINTGYLDTLDFKLEEDDQTYMIEHGKLACIAFLRERMAEKELIET